MVRKPIYPALKMVVPMKYWLIISTSLEMDIVYQTLERLKEAIQNDFHPKVILHSDQGFHYTHPFFLSKVKKLGITQSVSRKGNCWITYQ